MKRSGVKKDLRKTPLGQLIELAIKNKLLDRSLTESLKETYQNRNYFTYNIYALFSGQIDETILERENLVDTDVLLYIERTLHLHYELLGFADII